MATFKTDIVNNRFHDFNIQVTAECSSLSIRQVNHKFLFGSNIFGTVYKNGEDKHIYQQRIQDIWNAGTLPFYWAMYEKEENKPDPGDAVFKAAAWAKERGITLKGHPLCWHTLAPEWLMEYNPDKILGKVIERIHRDVSKYKGIIDCWDVINEVVIMPVFDKYDNAITRLANHIGAENLVLECFKAVREVNPQAYLLINDFDLSPDYEALIERLLDKGCSIDAIGLQTHQHTGYHTPDVLGDFLERFSRFKKPMHFTEITILSGELAPKVEDLNDIKRESWPSTEEGEMLQMEQVEEFYSQVYAHPLTEALVWWDIEDGNWLKAPAGLLRSDLTPKPAYKKLQKLIHDDWWFKEQTFKVSKGETFDIRAPEGQYEAEIDGKIIPFSLSKEQLNCKI